MTQTIQVIQGDTLNVRFSVSLSKNLINNLYFTCVDLGLEQELTFIEEKDGWSYWLLKMQTPIDLKPCFATYDLTIKYNGDDTKTSIHNANFNVLEKRNKTNGN